MRPSLPIIVLVAALPACPRRTAPARPSSDAEPSSAPIRLDPVDRFDPAPDAAAPTDAPIDRPIVVARGPWQRLPLARWSDPARLGTWDDPPDFDGDNVPDLAVGTVGRQTLATLIKARTGALGGTLTLSGDGAGNLRVFPVEPSSASEPWSLLVADPGNGFRLMARRAENEPL